MRIIQKRYYEQIIVTGDIKTRTRTEKKLLKKGYTITYKTLGGRTRFNKDKTKYRIKAEREILISEIPKEQ